ncbi:antitoxin YefM [Actinobacillus pleuropneumoniae]|nr:antitoxin YefM [Actinobacillus pleuropneumoniae]
MSYEQYSSLEETAYLMRSPANAQRLLDSMAELKQGKGIERELIE